MRNKYRFLLFGFFALCFLNATYSQDKFAVYGTFGFPEFINIGARYQIEQTQTGLGFMYLPVEDGPLYSISGDFLYHFAGKSKLSNRRPWFIRTGLTYSYAENEEEILKSLFWSFRGGREVNISGKFGFSFSGGIAFRLHHEKIMKIEPDYSLGEVFEDFSYVEFTTIWPSIGISVFYKL